MEVPSSNHFYNEINPYRARVLRARMAEGRLPKGVVDERSISDIPDADFLGFDQVHLFAGIGGFPLGLRLAGIPESGVSIVTGGFPCQDISDAGKRAGITGARSGLWREMARCIRVVRPQVALVENVAALLHRGMGKVLGDLARIGYDAQWVRVSAADTGAPHLRQRIWIAAYPARDLRRASGSDGSAPSDGSGAPVADTAQRGCAMRGEPSGRGGFAERGSETVADANKTGFPDAQGRAESTECHRLRAISDPGWWAVEPNVGRVADGVPDRVDRLAALGDAIVPQACSEAIRRLLA